MLIYNKLKEVRKLLKLTQTQVTEATGISQRDISQIENGEKKFIPTEYIQFLNKWNVPLDLIYNDDISLESFVSFFKKKLKGEDVKLQLYQPEESYGKGIRIPVLDISMAAGINGFLNSDNFEIVDYITLPPSMLKKGAIYAAGRAKGESMSPTIKDSDLVILRLLDRSEWNNMKDEYVHVIVADGQCFLKRVKNRFKKGFLVCMSDNVDKYNYPNFNLQGNEVTSIFFAEWLFTAKIPDINRTYYSRVKELEDKMDDVLNTLQSLGK